MFKNLVSFYTVVVNKMEMKVVKRNGTHQNVEFTKITNRIQKLCYDLDSSINSIVIAQKVITGLYDGVTTIMLDELAAETAAYMSTQHPDYSKLAARIAVSSIHKITNEKWSETVEEMYNHVSDITKAKAPLISEDLYNIVQDEKTRIDDMLDYSKDFEFDYFGLKTLERSYLIKIGKKVAERPQHLFMRIAVGIHGRDLEAVKKSYDLMSSGVFTHATPTMFNAGTCSPQMSSCFLLSMQSDSIDGIYETLKRCASISKGAGGIGLSISDIRATGSYIRGTGGYSNGLLPMLRVYDASARYVDQGGGKRKGSFAVYVEPWHEDIFTFMDMKKNHGKEEARARDLFYGLWIPDLFMKRVEENADWSLFCPNECPGLDKVWGDKFDELYAKYEAEKKQRRVVKAQELWLAIIESQIETGTPYMLYKDAANRKSNQQNLGTIRSSNLCTEIIEFTSPDEIAVCNLASVALPKFVVSGQFDFQKFQDVICVIVENLNRVIDRNFYPVEQARNSNMKHRPIGIGVQGLADVFLLLRMPYDSAAARTLNREIFECMYFAALTASCELAKKEGAYETFKGSPASKGVLQFDMWGVAPSEKWDWSQLKNNIKKHGLRNSLLVAPMPTASTAQILGNNECFEPYTSNFYSRRVLAGEFAVINKHLLRDLSELGIWNEELRLQIIEHGGSVQNIEVIPDYIKQLYKTAWELKMRPLIDMAADRGAFIDQSQSFNVFMAEPDYQKLTSMHFYGWKKGLKTGMYYLRTRPAADALQFTIKPKSLIDLSSESGDSSSKCELGCTSCGA